MYEMSCMKGNQYFGVIEISTPSGNTVRPQNGLIKFVAVIVVDWVIYVASYDP